MNLQLTAAERDRFATWLEQEAVVAKGLIEQMEKLGPMASILATRTKAEGAACLLIARRLRATEAESIG